MTLNNLTETLHQYSSIWFIDWTLSGATTPGQIGPGKGVLSIHESSKAGALPSDSLMSYLRQSLVGRGIYLFGEMQSVYSTALADRAYQSRRKETLT